MSETGEPPDGYMVPPAWLEANGLSPEEFAELKARLLAAVERGGPPVVLPPDKSEPVAWPLRTRLWHCLRWPYDVRKLRRAGFRRTGWKSWEYHP